MHWDIKRLEEYAKRNPEFVTPEVKEVLKNAPQEKNKYRNKKVEYDGAWFDSQWELDRYLQLELLEKAGEIKGLRRQVPFKLKEAKVIQVNGIYKKQRAMNYFADFVYFTKDDKCIVEDAKNAYNAKHDRTYINKRKLFIDKYGDRCTFMEVFSNGNSNEYKG